MCEALPFRPYRQKDFQWESLADDDFVSVKELIGGTVYKLRIEQMSKNQWWAALYINGDSHWDNSGEFVKTLGAAKRQVIRALNEHKKRV